MLAALRAGLLAVPLMLAALAPTFAADKPFQRADLADGAIKLEAQVKADAGTITKPIATLRRDADAALGRADYRAAIQVLGQIATLAPNESSSWLRLARTSLRIWPTDDRERTAWFERASATAYIAYQRAANRNEEADSLVVLSRTFAERKLWRPALDTLRLSLDLREVADVRLHYEKMRQDHGFRLLDYSVDSDAASPRACFQFSEVAAGSAHGFLPIRHRRRPGQARAHG